MKKQTAVDYIIEQLKQLAHDSNHHIGFGDIRITQGMLDELFEQAKEMEAEKDAKYNKMVEMLKRIYEIENDTFLSIDIEELIKEATEFKNK